MLSAATAIRRKTHGPGFLRTLVLSITLVLASVGSTTVAPAAVWTGAAYPDTNWSTLANWSGNMVPAPRSDLLLPEGAAGLTNYNDLAPGFSFNSITIGAADYRISGSRPLSLVAGLVSTHAAGASTIQAGIALEGNVTISNAPGGTLILNGAVNLAGNSATFANAGSVFVFNAITNRGGLAKSGPGALQLNLANSYDGLTRILEGRVTVLNNLGLGTTATGTVVAAGAELQILNGRNIAEPLELAGTLSSGFNTTNVWAGPVTLTASAATLAVNSGGALRVSGPIDGAGGFRKTLGGELRLTANNGYTGPTVIEGGTLIVDGAQPGSAVTIAPGGMLRGVNGHCGAVSNAPFGALQPGDATNLAALHLDGGLTCVPFSLVDLRILDGAGFDRLNVTGPVALSGATLQIQLNGLPPSDGAAFEIIANDGTDPIVGTFAALPEGALHAAGGLVFRISYQGGDGNDVVLTRVSEPSLLRSVSTTVNGLKQIDGLGVPHATYVLEATPGFEQFPVPWAPIVTNTADNIGVYRFIDQDSLLYPKRFYRVLSP